MKRINVSFAEPLLEELRAVVPARQRSKYINAAVREKLLRDRRVEAAETTAGIWSGEGREDPVTEVRTLRRAWQDRAPTDG